MAGIAAAAGAESDSTLFNPTKPNFRKPNFRKQ